MNPIPITIYVPEPPVPVGRGDQTQGWVSDAATAVVRSVRKEVAVLPQHLETSFRGFMDSMAVALQGIPTLLAGYQVDEVELALELTASGEVRLLAGAGLEGKAGIKLTLKRDGSAHGLNASTSQSGSADVSR